MATEKGKINPMAAGVVGAVVGAAGTAAAMALSDKQTRDKLGNKIKDLRNQGMRTYSEIRKKANKSLKDAGARVEEARHELKRVGRPKSSSRKG